MDQNLKQQAVEKIKLSSNVLVTVSANPSVDDLSAAIGFSLLLGKLNKHASAVFSGQIPPAIHFLDPSKRLDKDVNGLRDFIIALDKNKADKLRYKVEGGLVRIFITPYKSTLTQDDLTFSQGDFNVDVVVALGVSKREDLDNAIKAHGRILHDASVISINAGAKTSSLGLINWQDPGASSLCEMLVSISESFGSGLLDEQISTAFLTGIVAATERFSNPKTSPKIMTMAAQLMAAGANQQLIASNLDLPKSPEPVSMTPPPEFEPETDDSQIEIKHETQNEKILPPAEEPLPNDIPPPPTETTEPLPPKTQDATLKELEGEISDLTSSSKKSKSTKFKADSLPPPSQLSEPKAITDSFKPPDQVGIGLISDSKGRGPRDVDVNPLLGGTFNATSQQAHDETVDDIKRGVNSTLLSHPGKPLDIDDQPKEPRPTAKAPTVQPITPPSIPDMANPPVSDTPASSNPSLPDNPPPLSLPPTPPVSVAPPPDLSEKPSIVTEPLSGPVVPSLPDQNHDLVEASTSSPAVDDMESARKAVEEAINDQPFDPSGNPLDSIGSVPIKGEISVDQTGSIAPVLPPDDLKPPNILKIPSDIP